LDSELWKDKVRQIHKPDDYPERVEGRRTRRRITCSAQILLLLNIHRIVMSNSKQLVIFDQYDIIVVITKWKELLKLQYDFP
jgi:hypothetical protein